MLDRPISAMAEALRDGSVKAEAVIDEALERRQRLDARLNAYKHWDGERVLAEARAVDALIATGPDAGPLMGLPISYMDIFGVSRMPTFGDTLVRVGEAEAMLASRPLEPDLIAAAARTVQYAVAPYDDLHGSADFRRHLAGVLSRRVVEAAWRRALGDEA